MERHSHSHDAHAAMRAGLQSQGYWTTSLDVEDTDAVALILSTARSLGELFVPPGCHSAAPVIRTAPSASRRAAPFNRPEAIGWHGDFTTHADRPRFSLALVTRPDPEGGWRGAWRLASVAHLLEVLRATERGRAAFDLLYGAPHPFSYADGEAPTWFRVIELREHGLGLRYYAQAIRRGCLHAYGSVPSQTNAVLDLLESAADLVAEVRPVSAGSLLVVDNWSALHDRLPQSVGVRRSRREALLCFVR